MSSIKLFYHQLRADRTRYLLTLIAIIWGTFAISTMLAVGQGLSMTFNQAMAGSGNNLLIAASGETSSSSDGVSIGSTVLLDSHDVDAIKKNIPQIEFALPEVSYSADIHYGDQHAFAENTAVNSNYQQPRHLNVAAGGRFISPTDNQLKRRVVVLGKEVAKQLNPSGASLLNKTVMIGGQDFRVIGVLAKKLQFNSDGAPDSYRTWIPLGTYQALTADHNFTDIMIIPKKSGDMGLIKQRIRAVIARNHGVSANDPAIVDFSDLSETQHKTQTFFSGMQIFLGIIGLIGLVVAGIGIANVTLVSIKRQTKLIGVKMALGATTFHIIRHYLIEAIILVLLGGCIGVLLANNFVDLFDHIPMQGKFITLLGRPRPILSQQVIITVIIALGLTGFLSGLFPALKAATINPAEALRHD